MTVYTTALTGETHTHVQDLIVMCVKCVHMHNMDRFSCCIIFGSVFCVCAGSTHAGRSGNHGILRVLGFISL